MISNKLKKLYEIKQEIRESIEYISKQDVGTEFAYYPQYIKVYQNESDSLFEQYVIDGPEQSVVNDNIIEIWSTYKCVFDKDNQHLVLKEKLRDANESDLVLWIESSNPTFWRLIATGPVEMNSLWGYNENYDALTDIVTNDFVIEAPDFDFSYKPYLAMDNAQATIIKKIDYTAICGTDTKNLTWHYMPNLQRIDNFILKGDKMSLSGCFSHISVRDMSNLMIDLKNVNNLNYAFAYSKTERFPTFINTNSVTTIYGIFKGRNNINSDLDFSIFRNSPITNISCMFDGATIPANFNWSWLGNKKFHNPEIFRGYGTIDIADIIDNVDYDTFANLFANQNKLEIKNIELLSRFAPTSTDNMFYNSDRNFLDLDISWMDTSKLTNARNMFQFCRAETINLGEFDISQIPPTQNSYNAGMNDFLGYNYGSTHTVTGRFIGTIKFTNNQPFDLSSTILTADSVMIFFNALDEEYTSTIKISKTTYDYLSEEQLAVATSKGWTVSVN